MLRYHCRIIIFCFLLLISALSPPECSGAKKLVEELVELSIEQLMSIEISSTSFFDIPPEKAPGSIYLIPGDRIENSFASSIADFLGYYVPGVHISGVYSSGPLYSTRGIASSSNATTLLMLDGESMNISSGAGINTNLNLPLLGYIDRIEVLKGPCSIIHGSGSINGFVNIIQKNGKDHPGGFVNTEAGFPHDLMKAETGYGFSSKEKGDFFLYAGMVKSEGIKEKSINSNSFPDINTRFSLNWKKNNFRLTAFFQDESVDSTLKLRHIDESYSEVSMKSAALVPEVDFQLTDMEVFTIGLPFQYFEYEPDYLFLTSQNLDSELQIKPNMLLKTTRFPDHRIAMGFSLFLKRFRSDNIFIGLDDAVNGSQISTESYADSQEKIAFKADGSWLETSIFFEDNYQLSQNISLFAGLRYDGIYSDDFEFKTNDFSYDLDGGSLDVVTPRLGITWDLAGDHTLKFIYQEGYHYPDYINFMTYGDTTELLTEEDVKSYELGYYYNFMDNRCSFNLNFYYNVFDDTVYFLPDYDSDMSSSLEESDTAGGVEREISRRFASAGFEAALSFSPNEVTWFELSYGFSQPHCADDTVILNNLTDRNGKYWKVYPEHTVKLNFNTRLLGDKLDISTGCLYNNGIKTVEDTDSNDNDLFNHNRFVINASFKYNLTDRCSIIVKGENIFNNDVPAAGYYYDSLNKQNISLESPIYTIGFNWKF